MGDKRFINKVGFKAKVHVLGVEVDAIFIRNEFGRVYHTYGKPKELKQEEVLKKLPENFYDKNWGWNFLTALRLNRYSHVMLRVPVVVPDTAEEFFGDKKTRIIKYTDDGIKFQDLKLEKVNFDSNDSYFPADLLKSIEDFDEKTQPHYHHLTHSETKYNSDGTSGTETKKMGYRLLSTGIKTNGQSQLTHTDLIAVESAIRDLEEARKYSDSPQLLTRISTLKTEREIIKLTKELEKSKAKKKKLEIKKEQLNAETQKEDIKKINTEINTYSEETIPEAEKKLITKKKLLPKEKFIFMYEKAHSFQFSIALDGTRTINKDIYNPDWQKAIDDELAKRFSNKEERFKDKSKEDYKLIIDAWPFYSVLTEDLELISQNNPLEELRKIKFKPQYYSWYDEAVAEGKGKLTGPELALKALTKYKELHPEHNDVQLNDPKFRKWLKSKWKKDQKENQNLSKGVFDEELYYVNKDKTKGIKVSEYDKSSFKDKKNLESKYDYTPPFLTFEENTPVITKGIDKTKKQVTTKKGLSISSIGFDLGDHLQTTLDSVEVVWKNDFRSDYRNLINIAYKQYAHQLNIHPKLKLPAKFDNKYPTLDQWVLYALEDMDFTT